MSLESFFLANENNILALIVFAILIAFVVINRKKFAVEAKIFFIYRSKLGLKVMKSLSRFKRTINIFAIIGVIAAVGTIAFMLYLLVPYLELMISHPSTTPAGLQLVLPVSGVPGVFGVPIFYWLIAIIVVVALHEGAHGVVALSRKIKIKASGFGFFLAFLPLAFVEPEEKSFAKAKRFDRLKVLSAGSFINLIIGVIFLVVYILMSNYLIAAHAVSFSPLLLNISSVVAGGPAYNALLPPNTLITKINGNQFFTVQQAEGNLSVTPGQYVNLTTSSGQVYSIKTIYNISSATTTHSYIGISGEFIQQNYSQFPIVPIGQGVYPNNNLPAQTGYWFDGLFLWIAFISLGLGLANFLPIFYITDGCKIMNELLGYVIKDKKRLLKVTNAVIIAFSVLFLLLTPLGTLLFSVI
jgi:membrane-associated protease RseP (regulator of RpoE activity)